MLTKQKTMLFFKKRDSNRWAFIWGGRDLIFFSSTFQLISYHLYLVKGLLIEQRLANRHYESFTSEFVPHLVLRYCNQGFINTYAFDQHFPHCYKKKTKK